MLDVIYDVTYPLHRFTSLRCASAIVFRRAAMTSVPIWTPPDLSRNSGLTSGRIRWHRARRRSRENFRRTDFAGCRAPSQLPQSLIFRSVTTPFDPISTEITATAAVPYRSRPLCTSSLKVCVRSGDDVNAFDLPWTFRRKLWRRE